MAHSKKVSEFAKNLIIFGASLIVAMLLQNGGAFDGIIGGTPGMRILGTFVAGLFFTSFFTTAPAIVALGAIALASPSIVPVALIGGAGAAIGDAFMFLFVRDTISADARLLVCHSTSRRIAGICTGRIFRFLTPFLGALIIASPIPDEVGLSLLGFSRMPMKYFIPLSFVMNVIGIFIIGLVAHALI